MRKLIIAESRIVITLDFAKMESNSLHRRTKTKYKPFIGAYCRDISTQQVTFTASHVGDSPSQENCLETELYMMEEPVYCNNKLTRKL